MNAFDRRVIVSGAISGLFFALPAAVLQRTVLDSGALKYLMVGVIFFAGALAGYAAARPLPPKPLHHGAAAGVVTFAGAQFVYLIATHDLSNPVSVVFAIVFGGLMFASLGIIGAYVAVSSAGRRTGRAT